MLFCDIFNRLKEKIAVSEKDAKNWKSNNSQDEQKNPEYLGSFGKYCILNKIPVNFWELAVDFENWALFTY